MHVRTERTDEEKRWETDLIFRQYMDSLYRTACRMTKNESEAEDLVQDTYERAYRFFNSFESGTNAKAWLFKVMKNIFINKYRKDAKLPEMSSYDEGEDFLGNNPEVEIAIENIVGDEVAMALKKIPEDFVQVIIFVDLEGGAYKEAAEKFNVPIGTIMSRLFRGRRLLSEILKGYAGSLGYNTAYIKIEKKQEL